MNECTSIRGKLSAFYDGELDPRDRREVELHVESCPECRSMLKDFQRLSKLASEMRVDEPPEHIWTHLEKSLAARGLSPEGTRSPAVVPERQSRMAVFRFRRLPPQVLAAAAAVLVVAAFLVGYSLLSPDDHTLIRREITWLAENLNSDSVVSYLPQKYAGQTIDPNRFEQQYGYRPVAFRGLPQGYTVEQAHVMEMPCCRCIQTVCRKPDGSRVVILEHDDAVHGWMENSKTMNCNGVQCRCAELDGKMIASLDQGGRAVTVIGDLKKEDLDQLVASWSLADGR